jgi:hypothetical protein
MFGSAAYTSKWLIISQLNILRERKNMKTTITIYGATISSTEDIEYYGINLALTPEILEKELANRARRFLIDTEDPETLKALAMSDAELVRWYYGAERGEYDVYRWQDTLTDDIEKIDHEMQEYIRRVKVRRERGPGLIKF